MSRRATATASPSTDVDLEIADRLAPGGHRAERRRQEHAAQGHRRVCSRRSRARSRSSAGPPRPQAKRIAYVPQAEIVDWGFPVTVGDVVMMGRVPLIGIGRSPGQRRPRRGRRSPRDRRRWPDRRDRQIGALSGGQRRRVFLARALAAQARPVPPRRAGDGRRRDDPGGPDADPRGRVRCRAGRSSRRPTTWPAPRIISTRPRS